MNRPGPGQQPFRGMSSFPSQQQQQQQARPSNPSLLSGRMPNGKVGGAATWGFGVPMGGAPGLQNNQPRTVNAMNTFAQSVGGSQPATPLDLSEFPSLSGGSQPSQTPTTGQAVWSTINQRPAQQTLLQRQLQPPVSSQAPSRASQTQSNQPSQSHTSRDDLFPSGSQFATQLDDFRNGGQGISGQLSSNNQPQTGNIEEFPPLGKQTPGDLGQDRRESLMQSSNLASYGNTMTYANQGLPGQARTSVGSAIHARRDGTGVTSPVGATSASRSPIGPVQNGVGSQEQEDSTNLMAGQHATRPEDFSEQPQQTIPFPEETQPQETVATNQTSDQTPLTQMSDREKYGLAGLLRMIHSESPDVASLAIGQDLMSLGLDLNQPEPLHLSFASPFVPSGSGVPLQPDFTLPACYNVANVQPLQTRIPSFTDETLFYIFYSMPRDIMQELVAEELMGRKWRYHKIERAWLTRDDSYPNPVEVERGISERGVYLWWDTATWKKVRREFILRYADLDNRLDPARNFMRGMSFPQTS
ncbi:VIP2 protein [Coccidioides immitis RMSCC 3703]|uniref:VIP2 protein n=2 Tax=Coccidioides immitis TaxID=5501 RepID=A0A0J8R5Q5_COCIT|nr:VIP2 protein [Coccidioides immitis RMSCC 2394]KMU80439.1 VIP2 protein [Coccidioides immitis RMSCC 3703]